jgi:hypothetical protein
MSSNYTPHLFPRPVYYETSKNTQQSWVSTYFIGYRGLLKWLARKSNTRPQVSCRLLRQSFTSLSSSRTPFLQQSWAFHTTSVGRPFARPLGRRCPQGGQLESNDAPYGRRGCSPRLYDDTAPLDNYLALSFPSLYITNLVRQLTNEFSQSPFS